MNVSSVALNAITVTTMKQDLIISAFTLIPYLLVAWAFNVLSDGDASTFWKALVVLVAVRVIFAFIDMLGGLLRWRLWGGKQLVTYALGWFNTHQFPQRKYADDDMGNYLALIQGDPEQPLALRMAAAELERLFGVYEQFGILIGARFHSAYQMAFEMYAPLSRADKRSVFDEPYFAKAANVLGTDEGDRKT